MTRYRLPQLLGACVLLLTVGCTGTPPAPAGSASPDTSAPTTAPSTSAAPPSSAAPSSSGPSSTAPAGGKEVSDADAVFTWTMPCQDPRDDEITGSDLEENNLEALHAWSCGQPGEASAGALVGRTAKELTPAQGAALAKEFVSEVSGGAAKLTESDFQGHPGWTAEVVRSNQKIRFQLIMVKTHLAAYFGSPPDRLGTVLETVTIKG